MADEGQRHHYIPVAYLKNWMNAEGKICQYSKPYDERVVAKSKHPSGTGYIRGLYEFSGVQDQQLRDALEHEFMRPVDTRAAELLQEMVAGEQTMNNVEKRSSWTTFLLSLMFRMPEDIKFHKERYLRDWFKADPKRRKHYKKLWRPGMPNRVEDVIVRMDPQEIEWRALDALVPLMTNPHIGEFMNRMQWGTFTLPFHAPALLTSDRPLILSGGLIDPDSHILLPISPKRFFYAVNDRGVVNFMMTRSPSELAFVINRTVTQQAVSYVFSQWDVHAEFVQRHMGTGQIPSLVERMQNNSAALKGYKRVKRLRKKGLLP